MAKNDILSRGFCVCVLLHNLTTLTQFQHALLLHQLAQSHRPLARKRAREAGLPALPPLATPCALLDRPRALARPRVLARPRAPDLAHPAMLAHLVVRLAVCRRQPRGEGKGPCLSR